ncbi:MAG: hypothetical protein HFH02_03210 [Dorea sp.]|nr:hypothetical protein [Dorea sp.]
MADGIPRVPLQGSIGAKETILNILRIKYTGYNYQFSENSVEYLETDFNSMTIRDKKLLCTLYIIANSKKYQKE